MQRRSGIVTLTSDFGTRDAYVGVMKGVISSILPTVHLIDISHEIRPQNVLEAALLTEAAFPWFPAGTVHLVVVDPGVGTPRRPLAVSAGGHLFVGPDNGVLSAAFAAPDVHVHEITETAYELPERSDTFHGRDVFAPAAGHLASGFEVERMGPQVTDAVRLALPKPVVTGDRVRGEILRVDRFGNLLSSVPRSALGTLGPGPYRVFVDGRDFGALRRRYQDVPAGQPIALTGGDGRVELAVNSASAAETLRIAVGAPVEVVAERSDRA